MNEETLTTPQQICALIRELQDTQFPGVMQMGEIRDLVTHATPQEVKLGVLLLIKRRLDGIAESAEYQLGELNECITGLKRGDSDNSGENFH